MPVLVAKTLNEEEFEKKKAEWDPPKVLSSVDKENLIRSEYFISSSTGLRIYNRSWKSRSEKGPIGVVILVHGFGEHCGRYDNLIDSLTTSGFTVRALDHNGHGLSEGIRGRLAGGWQALVSDVIQLTMLHPTPSEIPFFLCGHSMGGLIASLVAIKRPDLWSGLVLSAPLMGAAPSLIPMNTTTLSIMRALAICAPCLPVEPPLPLSGLCSQESVQSAYDTDPLVYRSSIQLATGVALIDGFGEAQAIAPDLKVPLFLVISELDSYVVPDAAFRFFDKAGSSDKTKHVYPRELGLKHEVFNEVSADSPAIALVSDWLELHAKK